MKEATWMVYGANGFTAGLIIDLAVKEGLTPILAGRSEIAIKAIAEHYNLQYRIFDLHSHDLLVEILTEIDVLVHAAGPYLYTATPMLEACIVAKTHYLDITGEYTVFQEAERLDSAAIEAGVVLTPGVGYDIIPTDGLTRYLVNQHPKGKGIKLALYGEGGFPSKGTTATAIEALSESDYILKDGEVVKVKRPYHVQNFTFEIENKVGLTSKERLAMTIGLPDPFTAKKSTGIENLRIYFCSPSSLIRGARLIYPIRGLFRLSIIKWLVKKIAIKGDPDETVRKNARNFVLGEIYEIPYTNKPLARYQLSTMNGYDFTAIGTVHAVKTLLDEHSRSGYLTPSQLMGIDWIFETDGIELKKLKNW